VLIFDDFSLMYRGPFKDDMREGTGVITSEGIQDEIDRLRIPKVLVQLGEGDEYFFEAVYKKDAVIEEIKTYAKGRYVNKV
jgi:dihydrofolate reductase